MKEIDKKQLIEKALLLFGETSNTENIASITAAVNELVSAIDQNQTLNQDFIEKAAGAVHAAWLIRNRDSADESEKKSYENLTEAEKDKDRLYIIKVLETYNS